MTGSLERALSETARRREIQLAYNKKHGITPRTVVRAIRDMMPAAAQGQPSISLGYSDVRDANNNVLQGVDLGVGGARAAVEALGHDGAVGAELDTSAHGRLIDEYIDQVASGNGKS